MCYIIDIALLICFIFISHLIVNSRIYTIFFLSVPPDILDYPTSTDMVVDEGANVTLQCVAKGSPEPKVIWKREDGEKIDLHNNSQGKEVDLCQ